MAATLMVFTCAFSPLANAPPAAVFPGAAWEEATPESQGVDAAKLKDAVAYMDRSFGPDGARELVIIRNGYLIWKGPDADACHNVWSATKVFTSTLLGLLVGDGKCTLEDLAVQYLPDLDDLYPLYSKIRLRHLASMSSGYQGQVVNVTPEQPWGEPLAYLTPTAPLFEAGTQVQYHDHQVFLLGCILTRLAGESMKSLFQRRIAGPIGMTRWDWGVNGKIEGIDLNNAAGTPTTPGIQTTACEMARFGLLYLNRGRWNGRQLLPISFVEEATKNQVPGVGASSFLHHRYGFYWWTNDLMPNGQRPWPSAPPRAYTSHGHSANFCFVIPEWQMVVVRLGTSAIRDGVAAIRQVEELWDGFFSRLASGLRTASQGDRAMNRKTEVSIRGDAFYLNGRPTYEGRTWQGHKIEGLLFNSRMVQGIFDDLNPETRRQWAYPDTGQWDPERNTREFLAAMPEWRRHGLLAFTLNLQGGNPRGYAPDQPWHNSAFTADGTLRPDYLARLERILDRADELGMVVILGLFYFGQDQRLRDEAAVLRGLDHAVEWVLDHDYRHVLIEVNNECNVRYDHAILQPGRVHELMERVKAHQRQGRRLLVSTSYGGGTLPGENVVRQADFLLLHGNGVEEPERIAEMVRQTRRLPGYRPMPILFNEDDHFNFDQPRNNLLAAIGEYCSWGFFDPGKNNYVDGYQSPPVNWGLNTERKRAFFTKLQEITGE